MDQAEEAQIQGQEEDKMNVKLKFLLISIFIIYQSGDLLSQNIEDALRFTNQNANISSRYAALGIAYTGIADDGAAIRLNAAGIGLISGNEISLGFNFTNIKNNASYLGVSNELSSSSPYLTNASIVAPLKLNGETSKLFFGFSYNLENDFQNTMSVSAFNPNNSFIKYEADNSEAWTKDLLLTDSGSFNTVYLNQLHQDIYLQENGGLHSYIFAFSYSFSENFLLGLSLGSKNGTYEYSREFKESDINNIYNLEGKEDLDYIKATESYKQDVSGLVSSISFIGKVEDFMRVGINIDFPVTYSITEDFYSKYESQFDKLSNGIVDRFETKDDDYTGYAEYDVQTPFTFTFASSVNFLNLTLSAAIKYCDNSTLKFDNGVSELLKLNTEIAKKLTGTMRYGIGVEYLIPSSIFTLRASYENVNSAFKDNTSTISIIGTGIGLLIDEKIMLDVFMRMKAKSNENLFLYDQNIATISNSNTSFGLGLKYRY